MKRFKNMKWMEPSCFSQPGGKSLSSLLSLSGEAESISSGDF